MEPSEYLALLRKHWLMIAALGVLGFVGGYAYSQTIPPSFRATASIVARRMTLCFPITMYGPTCSTPPVGMITVRFPPAMRSRTSIQVSSSSQTESWMGRTRGVRGSGPPWAAREIGASRTARRRARVIGRFTKASG